MKGFTQRGVKTGCHGMKVEAQGARVCAERVYKSLPAGTTPARRAQALREWLAISLLTLMPPDRVVRACLTPSTSPNFPVYYTPRLLLLLPRRRALSVS